MRVYSLRIKNCIKFNHPKLVIAKVRQLSSPIKVIRGRVSFPVPPSIIRFANPPPSNRSAASHFSTFASTITLFQTPNPRAKTSLRYYISLDLPPAQYGKRQFFISLAYCTVGFRGFQTFFTISSISKEPNRNWQIDLRLTENALLLKPDFS